MVRLVFDYLPQEFRYLFKNLFSEVGYEEKYKSHEIIRLTDDKNENIWFIRSGKLKHVLHDIEGHQKTALILTEGDIFGEMSLFQNEKNLTLIQTMEPSVVNRIPKEIFFDIISTEPYYYHQIIQSLNHKIRIIMFQISDLSFNKVDKRLANLLVRLSDQHGVKVENGIAIEITLTHQELANMICATRPSVTRSIHKFQKQCLLSIENKKYILLDKKKLSNWKE